MGLRTQLRNAALQAGVMTLPGRTQDEVGALIRALRPDFDQERLFRIGGEADGGYLVPDALDGIKALFSPGVAETIDFELDLERRGIRAHLCDASIDAPPAGLSGATFDPVFLGPEDREGFLTLSTWFSRYASVEDRDDYMLQMDIEGAEYSVLLATPQDVLRKFRIIVLELHHLDELFGRLSFTFIRDALSKLLTDFRVAHLHPNNVGSVFQRGNVVVPNLMEVTLIRKDHAAPATAPLRFPHELDRPCVDQRPELPLPACWYRDD